MLKERAPHLYLRVVNALIHFGYRPSHLYESVLNNLDMLETVISERNKARKYMNVLDLLYLQQRVKSSPGLNVTLSDDVTKLLDAERPEALLFAKENVGDYPLMGALERGLGGSQYVQTGILTKYGVHIDHLVILRKGNYPVAVSPSSGVHKTETTEVIMAEDLVVPSDAKRVAILVRAAYNYAANTLRLRSSLAQQADLLASDGYVTVQVPLPVWSGLPEHERIPYLMREMRNCVENDDYSLSGRS
jgi:FAST kinase domain-containing protein 2